MHKTLIISILFVFVMVTNDIAAQRPRISQRPQMTSMTISSDHQAFWLFLDDMLQNEKSVMSIKVEAIPEGEHYLRVEIDDIDHHTVGQTVRLQRSNNSYWVDNQRHLYGISLGHGVPRPEAVVYYASVQQNVPGYHGYAPGQYGNYPPQQPYPTPQPNQTVTVIEDAAMPDPDFQQALMLIKSESFETTKLNTAKQVLANNLLNVSQIEQICRAFDYENSKLDFAKSAYNHCVEKEKYYLLNSVFEFESSKKALNEFLKDQQ
ncbi:MAG: DUF4476 domain-containing protein [Bacteroidales bacterium]|nr:DUF4476 domain-containing protein [Bacteroidales bacterium]